MAKGPRRPRIPTALAERIDAARGFVPFEVWVRTTLAEALGQSGPALGEVQAEVNDLRVQRIEDIETEIREDPPHETYSHGRVCPVYGCDWTAPSPNAYCPTHQRKIK